MTSREEELCNVTSHLTLWGGCVQAELLDRPSSSPCPDERKLHTATRRPVSLRQFVRSFGRGLLISQTPSTPRINFTNRNPVQQQNHKVCRWNSNSFVFCKFCLTDKSTFFEIRYQYLVMYSLFGGLSGLSPCAESALHIRPNQQQVRNSLLKIC